MLGLINRFPFLIEVVWVPLASTGQMEKGSYLVLGVEKEDDAEDKVRSFSLLYPRENNL